MVHNKHSLVKTGLVGKSLNAFQQIRRVGNLVSCGMLIIRQLNLLQVHECDEYMNPPIRKFPFRLLNVFAESVFGGNPLCVFESGKGLSDIEMQSLALQFNLSETTFILPAADASAEVRIFTPAFEMAFAGHPTLGTSHVVRDLFNAGDRLTLKMTAGIIPVSAEGDVWTFTANAPCFREFAMPRHELAAILGLKGDDILDGASWVDTGSEQLIVPLASADAVRRTQPIADRLATISSEAGRSMAYVFAPNGEGNLLSRFFFFKHGSVIEDPGTGSATANLGGWYLKQQAALPLARSIDQGEMANRPCRIGLAVDASRRIRVSGKVREIGRGEVTLA